MSELRCNYRNNQYGWNVGARLKCLPENLLFTCGRARRLAPTVNRIGCFVGDDESHLPVRSVLLLRRGVHRTPAPHIVPFQSVSFTFCGRMWASAPTFIVYISVANNSTNYNLSNTPNSIFLLVKN